jgi:hypothetical protein
MTYTNLRDYLQATGQHVATAAEVARETLEERRARWDGERAALANPRPKVIIPRG